MINDPLVSLAPFVDVVVAAHVKAKEADLVDLTLPTPGVLQELSTTCLLASLRTEESRSVLFTVMLIKTAAAVAARRQEVKVEPWHIAAFDERRHLTAHLLAKLALSVDPSRGAICIYSDARGELWVHGVCWFSSGWTSADFLDFKESVPPFLAIRCTGPASLRASMGGEILAAIRLGEIVPPGARAGDIREVSAISRCAGSAINTALRHRLRPLGVKYAPADLRFSAQFHLSVLLQILGAVQSNRHGGTIVVVPEESTIAEQRQSMRVGFPLRSERIFDLMVHHFGLDRRLVELGGVEGVYQEREVRELKAEFISTGSLLRDAVASCAHLAHIDGAVLMDRRMGLYGYGVELRAARDGLDDVKLWDARVKQWRRRSVTDFGMRHRSAFAFVRSAISTVAFVVSQDGGIRVVSNRAGSVCVWPDLRVLSWGV